MSDDLFYWTSESTRVKDYGVSPIQEREVISSLALLGKEVQTERGESVTELCNQLSVLVILPSINSELLPSLLQGLNTSTLEAKSAKNKKSFFF